MFVKQVELFLYILSYRNVQLSGHPNTVLLSRYPFPKICNSTTLSLGIVKKRSISVNFTPKQFSPAPEVKCQLICGN